MPNMSKRIESIDLLIKNKDAKVLAGIKKELREMRNLAKDVTISVQDEGIKELTEAIDELLGVCGKMEAHLEDSRNALFELQKDGARTADAIDKLNESLDDTGSIMYENAAATHKVKDEVSGLNKTTKQLEKNSRKTNATLKRMDTHAMSIGRSFGKLAKSGNKLSLAINVPFASALATVYALQTALTVLTGGDQINKLEKLNSIITASSGEALSVMADRLSDVSGGALSAAEAMKVAAKGAAYGFNKNDMEKFMKGAKAASAQLGRDVSETLNRAMEGVAKLEKEQLDELGLTFSQLEAQKAYAEKNKITGELDSTQKAEAFKEMFFERMENKYGRLMGTISDPGPWEKFGKAVRSNMEIIQASLADTTSGFADFLTTVLTYKDPNLKLAKDTEAQTATLKENLDNEDILGVANSLVTIASGKSELQTAIDKNTAQLESLNKFTGKKVTETLYGSRTQTRYVGGAGYAVGDAARITKEKKEHDIAALKEAKVEQDTLASTEGMKFIKERTTLTDPKEVSRIFSKLNLVKEGSNNQLNTLNTQMLGQATAASKQLRFLEEVNEAFQAQISILTRVEDKTAAANALGYESVEAWNEKYASIKAYAEATKGLATLEAQTAYTKLKAFKEGKLGTETEIKLAGRKTVLLRQQLAELKKQGAVEDVLAAKRAEISNNELARQQAIYSLIEQRYSLAQKMATLQGLQNPGDKVGSAELAVKDATKFRNEVHDNGASTQEQRLDADIKLEEAKNNLYAARYSLFEKNAGIEEKALSLSLRMSNLTQTQTAQRKLELIDKQLANMEDEKGLEFEEKRRDLAYQRANAERDVLDAKRQQRVAMFNATSVSGLQSREGMNSDELKLAQTQAGMAMFNEAFSGVADGNAALESMFSNLGALSEGMLYFGQSTQTGMQLAVQGMQTVSSMMQYTAQQQTSAIDQQIAAEKKRDGKSKESVAKIKQLEAKKRNIENKAARERIVTNTASGIMMALGTLPYPMNLVQAGLVGVMGAMQLSKVGSNSLGGSEGDIGSKTTSLSIGKRSNEVDVSKSATGGELSYLRGERGTGSIQNFQSPRANGGYGEALQSLVVGEHGREVITPQVPVTVTPADRTAGVTNIYNSYNTVNAQMLNTEGLEEWTTNFVATGLKGAADVQHPDLQGLIY